MKLYKLFLHLFCIFCLISCNDKSENKSHVKGEWIIEKIEVGRIGGFGEPKVDNDTIPKEYLSLKSSLNLKPDYTFIFNNNGGTQFDGYYEIKNDSIILKSKRFTWLSGKFENINNSKIILILNYVRFYEIRNDSIFFYTGTDNKIVLNNKNDL
jgi:hypothetical protein